MDPQLISFLPNLRCPISGQQLQMMSAQSLEKLNAAIEAKQASTYEGELQESPVQEALLSMDGQYSYPVIDGYIAALLPNQAIMTERIETGPRASSFSKEKKSVQQFYDDFGWQKTEEGYKDTLTFEDRRPVSEKYWSKCHMRLNKYLSGGEYLLDVASGSVPNDEYLTFSDRYHMRICMDFSVQAMKEAARRLKGKGIFIQGDMTEIPIVDNCIDSVISMHTVYHIPQQEQTKAVQESYRILKPGGQSVIVYNWHKPLLMRMAFGIWRPLLRFYKRLKGAKSIQPKPQAGQAENRPELFLQQQDYKWFTKDIKKPYKARLEVYSCISRSFSNTFIQEKAFGRQLSGLIFKLENIFPSFLGRWGQYPVFLLQKKKSGLRVAADRKAMPLEQAKPGSRQAVA
jgi:ubiquinone/menaquinone biosynthesis C-methylase UbiE/uncharacterized protein YbaR (Trm112 family)